MTFKIPPRLQYVNADGTPAYGSTPVAGYVYVIKPVEHNIYKIGCSVDPERRLYALQSRIKGVRMEMIAAAYSLDYQRAEIQWHIRYRPYQIAAEWFALPTSEVEEIVRLYGGGS